ncbi:MAG: VWA domain-containing protein [Bryobacterales bacterium]|nr:VWA domain-containing protein [Acidobacteriota bacterium]MCB9384218.1 VWA domain-containing protein [Bryobacterales bacterium]
MERLSAHASRRGQIILLFALFIGFLLGFAALAFDMAYAMVVRAQLVTALDAATLAAIRYAPDGPTAMSAAAQRTFSANLPAGRLLVSNPTISTPTITPDNGATLVTFNGTADIPTFFARWFGTDGVTINAATTAARRDRNIVLVLDYSGSVKPVFDQIKQASKAFVNSFSDETDQVGLVIFSTAGRIEIAPKKPFKTDLNAAIDALDSEMYTNHSMGVYYAYRSLLELNDALKDMKMNEIVLFTDGRANWFPGRFNVQVGPCTQATVDGVYGIGNNYYGNRVLSMQAPTSPGKPALVAECPGWSQGTNALQSIQALWYPPTSPTAGEIFPAGIALAGFKNSAPPLFDNDMSNAEREEIAANVVDNLARKVRQDGFLKPRIHVIGYEGNSPLEQSVLERLSNCGGCANVDPVDATDTDQAKGKLVLASNQAQLMQAFLEVSGFIGRITQ